MTALVANEIAVRDGATPLLSPISLKLEPGEPLIVVGETGSGKSLLAQAMMGTLTPGLSASGRVTVKGKAFDVATPREFAPLWGRTLAVLPQEPWLSLDPLMRADRQIAEAHRLVAGRTRDDARKAAQSDLDRLGLSGAGRKYPHALSGGMAQRVSIAAARAGGGSIVIADEPTKGLDAALRDDVADMLADEMAGGGALMVITHDLELARRLGGRIIILRDGAMVEEGQTRDIFAAPKTAYTKELIGADPVNWQPRMPQTEGSAASIIAAEGLSAARNGQRLFEGLSLSLKAGEVLGVTGPSGCGKSTLGDVLLGLAPAADGRIARAGQTHTTAFQKLYQDPVAAFPRTRRIGRALGDVAKLHGVAPGRIETLLPKLGLDPILLEREPGAVSGGELQRLALLRLLLVEPRFIFADEPTSRLDPITQRTIINLLVDTAKHNDCAIMLVSHDRALIEHTADRSLTLEMAVEKAA